MNKHNDQAHSVDPFSSPQEQLLSLEKRLAESTDSAEKARFHALIGQLYIREIGNLAKAEEHFKAAFEATPDDAAPLLMLRQIAQKQAKWQDAVRYGEAHARLMPDSQEKADLYLELASMWVNHFAQVEKAVPFFLKAADLLVTMPGGEEKALSLYLQALSLAPNEAQAFMGLARICSQRKYWKRLPVEYQVKLEKLLSEQQRWEDLLAIYQGQVEAPEDSRQVAMTYLKMGELFEHTLKRPESALNAYKMALALFPQDLRAFEAVRHFLRRKGRFDDLVDHLQGQLEFIDDKDRQLAIAMEIARVEQHDLGDLPRARTTYLRILEIDSQYFPAHEALSGLYEQAQEWRNLYQFLKQQLQRVSEPRLRGAIHETLGKVTAEKLGFWEEAESHFIACMRMNPTNLSAIRGLDFVHSKKHDWDKLVPMLIARATQSRDSREKARAYGRLGRFFWEVRNDAVQSEQHFRRMIDLTDSKLLGYQLLDRLYRKSNNIEGRIELFRERAHQAASPERRRELLLDLARELEVNLQMPERAEAIYKEIQNFGIEDPNTADSLKRLYRDQERWQDLYELCREELLTAADDVRRVENLLILAELDEYQFEHHDKAARSYEEVLRINARNLTALKGLERIYLKTQDWMRLREVYRRGIDLAQDLREEAYLCLRLGQVTEHLAGESGGGEGGPNPTQISLRQEAAKYYEAALLRDPELVAAMKGLIGLYELAADWPGAVRVRKLYTETLDEAVEKAEQYFRIAEIFEQKLNRDADAVREYEDAARLDPDHLGVMRRLAVTYYQTEQWEKSLSVHEALAQRMRLGDIKEPQEAMSFFYRLGIIYSKLQRFSHAKAAMIEAKKINPGFVPVRKSLADFYFLDRDWRGAVDEYRAVLPVLSAEEQTDAMLKLAASEAALGDLEQAESHFKQVLARDPLNEAATGSLVNLYQSGARHEELAELLSRRMMALDSPTLNRQEGLKLAQLQANVIADLPGALRTAERLHGEHPDDEEIYRVLHDLYQRANQVEPLGGLLRRRLLKTGDSERPEVHALRLELAEVLELQQPESLEALTLFQEAINTDPKEARALNGLERIYLKQKHWHELLEIYETQRRLAIRDEEAAILSFKIGEIQSVQLKRDDDAVLSYKDALTKDPGLRPAIGALKKLYETRGEWERLPALIIQEIERAEGRGEEARLHFELGKLFEERLTRPDKALKHFQDSLRVFENYMPAARRLAVHYYQAGDWENAEKYYDLLVRDFEQTERKTVVPRVAAGFFYKYGKIAERLGKEEKSIHCYRRSLEYQQDFFPSLAALAEVCQRKGWWDEAKLCVEQILRLNLDPLQASPQNWQYQLASIEERLGNRELSVARHKEVVKLQEDFIPSLQALVKYYEEDGKWRVVVGLYDKLLAAFARQGNVEKQFESIMAKGEVWENRLQDSEQAGVCYREAEAVAGHKSRARRARKALVDLAVRGRRWNDVIALLAPALEEDAEMFGSPVDYRLYLAEGYLQQGFTDAAVRELGKILASHPRHVRALELQGELLAKASDWRGLAANLEAQVRQLSPQERAKAAILTQQIGDLLSFKLKEHAKAVEMYRKALQLDPNAVEVHRKLAALYSEDEGFYQQAVKEHHFLTASEPLAADSYHHLGSIYEARGEIDRARAIYECLQLIGEANEHELASLKRYPPKRLQMEEKLNAADWKNVLQDPLEKNAMGDLWDVVAGQVSELFTLDLQGEGREGLKEIPWQGDATQLKFFAQMAKVFGVSAVRLYAVAKPGLQAEVFPTRPVSILASEGVLKLNNPAGQRFLFARALAHLHFEHVLPLYLPEEQLKRLFLLIAKFVREDLTLEGYDDRGIRSDLKKIKRAISKKTRLDLEPVVDEFLKQVRKLDFKSWRQGMEQTADRAGLLMAQDLRAALEMLSVNREGKTMNLLNSHEVLRLLQSQERAMALFKFYASPEFFQLRDKMGFAQTGLIV